MAKGTCKMHDCECVVLARGLCSKHYTRFRNDGTLEDHADPSSFGAYHRITELDPESRTGVCSICGPVRVRLRNGGRGPACYTQRLKEIKRRPPRPPLTGSQRRRQALSRYKMSEAELDALVARADGRCEICDAPTDFEQGARVDHCHETGLVRGLLCHPCNIGIAWFRDDPQRVLSAHFYLTGARTEPQTA